MRAVNQISERILSLDVFRGLIMALMVLVNSQGTRVIYPILEHASWNGCTLADLVFPSFLFIVGITTVISLRKHINLEGQCKAEIYSSILKRSVLLFLFGVLLNAYPYFNFSTLRIYGILQRIALCYFLCAMIYLHTSIRTQVLILVGILIGYWYFITSVPMPGGIGDPLSRAHNWVLYLDRILVSPAHMYRDFDPEGLLSTLPALATTLSGLLTGQLLLASFKKQKKYLLMLAIGLLFLLLGWVWGYSFPINKNLWTSSFVLWTSGISLLLFACCFYIIDVLAYTRWAIPFKILGMNALFIFIFHVILLKTQSFFQLPLGNGDTENMRVALANYLFGGLGQENAGLLYALVFLFLNFLVAVFLYKRKIFFKL